MLVPEAHHYGGTWAFYVIAPVILCGVVASLWLIVKGAIGVFGQMPRGERLSTIPSTTGSSSRTVAAKRRYRTLRGRTSPSEGASPRTAQIGTLPDFHRLKSL
jgi:hypothetical protein